MNVTGEKETKNRHHEMCFAIGHGGQSTITASDALDREFVTGFVLLRHCKTKLFIYAGYR